MQFLKRRALIAGGGALSLAACTPDGQGPTTSSTAIAADAASVPRYTDPLAGLFNMPAAAVPNDVAVDYYTPKVERTGGGARAVLTMALVPGANFSRLRAYHQAFAASSSGIFSSSSTVRDLDIQPVLRQAVEQLKVRYPWLELMEDLAAADAANVSLTLVFDIRSTLGVRSGDATEVQLDCIVFDERRKPVSRIAVEGRATASSVPGFQEAAADALSRLDSKARMYLT